MTHLDEALTRIYHNKVGEGAVRKGPLGWFLVALSKVKRGVRRVLRRR